MKSVWVDLERAKYPFSGLGTFCRELGSALHEMSSEHIKTGFFAPATLAQQLHLNTWSQPHFWQKAFASCLPRGDLWHSTHQDSAYLPRPHPKQKLILTIHDLNFLTEKSPAKSIVRLKRLQQRVDQASVITTISKYTKQIIQDRLQVGNKSIEVIYNGASAPHSSPEANPGLQDKKFLFSLGVMIPRKNFASLIDMMLELPDYDLALAGGPVSSPYLQQLKAQCRRLRLESRVHFLGPVSSAQRTWLYQNCQAFLFPSLLEGFGLPVVEAMGCGKLVVCSGLTSLPEVGGPHAHYWQHFAPTYMAELLLSALSTYHNNCLPLSEDYRRWSKQFSWAQAAAQYWQIYERELGFKP